MKISCIEKVAPSIVELNRQRLRYIKYPIDKIDEAIEKMPIEFLVAYAHNEKHGLIIEGSISLLSDFKRLNDAEIEIPGIEE